jgi:hypothetical protein
MQFSPILPTAPFQPSFQGLYSSQGIGTAATEDFATVYVDIQVYVTEEVPVLYFDIQVSAVEAAQYTDAATVYVDIRNTGGECYSSFSGLFLDADAQTRWATPTYEERWFCDEDAVAARWGLGGYEERWFTDEDTVNARWAVTGLSSDNDPGC